MSALAALKAATSLHDLARLLGYQPKYLAYLVRVLPARKKYSDFPIPKRSGGHRTISAPRDELKQLQRRLSDRLQDCLAEIEIARKVQVPIAHGFKRGASITTNASVHRRRRYVLNLDLSDFFGTINFGRVRGFFLKNRDFQLAPDIATLIAQIACHNNALPQGSPCSPVISNLIVNILDMHLVTLARATGCAYSRYADDLTFSTSQEPFPPDIAFRTPGDPNVWQLGPALERAIAHADYRVNPLKTRMQYCRSRQTVTGVVVNRRLNTRVEYRRATRAMVHRLLRTGTFEVPTPTLDAAGQTVLVPQPGTVARLEGMLAHVLAVDNAADLRKEREAEPAGEPVLRPSERLLRDLVFYRHFAAAERPLILTEGKTDRIYIDCALKSLASRYPGLVTSTAAAPTLSVKLFRYTPRMDRLLHLGGGTGDIKGFLKRYRRLYQRVRAPKGANPVILLIDNDAGSAGLKALVENFFKVPVGTSLSVHIMENVYLVLTPPKTAGKASCIEDCFTNATLDTRLHGKTFNYCDQIDPATEYGKQVFAEKVVKPSAASLDFSGFIPLLDAVAAIVAAHAASHAAAS